MRLAVLARDLLTRLSPDILASGIKLSPKPESQCTCCPEHGPAHEHLTDGWVHDEESGATMNYFAGEIGGEICVTFHLRAALGAIGVVNQPGNWEPDFTERQMEHLAQVIRGGIARAVARAEGHVAV